MSGSGRKSQYRKSVTTTFLDDNITPEEHEKIVVVLGNRGDNTFEIRLESGEKGLARLPKKFNKLIWIKTGDYIIIEDDRHQVTPSAASSTAPDVSAPASTEAKEQYTIKHILSKPNVKYLRNSNMWPVGLDGADTSAAPTSAVGSTVFRSEYDMPISTEQEDEEGEYEDEEPEVLYDKYGNTIED